MQPIAAGYSHVGKVRKRNEDSFRLDAKKRIYVVCDGVGGGPSGNVASRVACEIMLTDLARRRGPWREAMAESLRTANAAVYAAAQTNGKLRNMATTGVALVIRDGKAYIGHVGDSRAYLLSSGVLDQITEDDSSKMPGSSPYLTQVLGSRKTPEAHVTSFPLHAGDVVLLCSDGISNMMHDAEIHAALEADSPEDRAKALVARALLNGGHDNATAIVVEIQ